MAENKSLILVDGELVKKSRQTPHRTSPDSLVMISTSPPKHLLDLAVEVDKRLPSWFAREVSRLQIFLGQ